MKDVQRVSVTPVECGKASPLEYTFEGHIDHGKVEFTDPIIVEKLVSSNPADLSVYYDPMTSLEVEFPMSAPQYHNMKGSLLGESNKRPHGTPKKNNIPCGVSHSQASRGVEEAQHTWLTAKMLGISSNNDEAVICKL